jgi:hypothetical protein
MESQYIVKAIKNLHPTAEFSFIDDDFLSIQWDVLEGSAPTKAEITAEIAKIKAQEEADKAAKATDKNALLNKLGITAEEAVLLLG